MPEEPLDNEQQPEPTPHFDAFSGHNSESGVGPGQTPTLNPNPNPTPSPVPEVPVTPTPLQDGPMTSFAPNPVVSSEFARVPDAMAAQPVAPVISSKKPKWFKQKKFIIGIIVAVLVLLVGGGSAFAYVSYYQNPQKVISDSLINAVTAKSIIATGTLNVSSSGTNVKVEITSKTANATGSFDAKLTVVYGGKTYNISGSALIVGTGDVYFKLSDLAGIVAQAKTSIGISQTSALSTAVDKLVTKIDGTWVKISSNDLKQYSADTATSKTCINDTIKKYKDDKSAIGEITDLYTKHQFIVVEKNLGQVDGSFGYQIKNSNAQLKAFLDGLKNTKIYNSLHNCDKTFVIDTTGMSTKDETDKNNTVKLWVDVWSHQITKVELNSKDSGTTASAMILPKFNQTVTITAPTTSISLTQLQSYIQDLFTSMQSGSQL
jgi:hypothetical protein